MRAWIFVGLGVVAGCSGSRAGGTVSPIGLTISATIDRPAVRPGESLQILITVTNTSASKQTLQFSSGCQTDFEFLDSVGKVARSSLQVCPQIVTQRSLEPGAAFSDAHTWTRGPLDPPELAAGSYQLRGVLLATGDTIRSASVAVSLP